MKTDTRALAAKGLADVALRGASLRDVMAHAAPKLTDPRDRALLMALLSEGARWWLRFDAAIDGLLEKPLRHKDPAVHALLVLGLVQLEILELQDYAAVAATVEAVRALKRPQLAGLVNAVLRRWQRERESLLAQLDGKPQTRHAHPAWLAAALERDWPAQADRVMSADNCEPPLTLRVNRQRSERAALIEQLQAAGYAAIAHPWLADALVLPHSADVTRMPGFDDGHFAVQDGAAQVAADLADLRNGLRVLDACAAPGRQGLPPAGARRYRPDRAGVRAGAGRTHPPEPDAAAPERENRDRRCRRAQGLVERPAVRPHPARRAMFGHRRAAASPGCAPAPARERHRRRCRRSSGASWPPCGRCSRRAGGWSTSPVRCCARRTRPCRRVAGRAGRCAGRGVHPAGRPGGIRRLADPARRRRPRRHVLRGLEKQG